MKDGYLFNYLRTWVLAVLSLTLAFFNGTRNERQHRMQNLQHPSRPDADSRQTAIHLPILTNNRQQLTTATPPFSPDSPSLIPANFPSQPATLRILSRLNCNSSVSATETQQLEVVSPADSMCNNHDDDSWDAFSAADDHSPNGDDEKADQAAAEAKKTSLSPFHSRL